MDIKDVHIGQKVMTKTGRIGTVDAISSDSVYVMFGSSVCGERMRSSDLSPAIDSCASCEMAATITSQCKQIAELQRSVEAWTETAARHCRNESYYRDELTKLQKEALAVDKRESLSDVVDELRMSQEARRVIEYIAARDCSCDMPSIIEDVGMWKGKTIDALAEARDAGKIALVDGKYEIVRD